MASERTSSSDLTRGEEAERRGDLLAAANAYTIVATSADMRLVGAASFRLGRVAWRQGRYDDALRFYERARALGSEQGDEELVAQSENGIGALRCEQGAYVQARASYLVALERTAQPALRGRIQLNLGVLANILGDLEEARARYARSLSEFDAAGDEEGAALVHHNLGMLHADRADWAAAAQAYERALSISERLGMRQMVANVLLNCAEVLCARKQPGEAVASSERALALYEELGDQSGRAEAHRWKGRGLVLLGDGEGAREWLEESVRLATQLGTPLLVAEASRDLGELCAASNDIEEARTYLARALEGFETLGASRDADAVRAQLARLGA